MMLSVTLTLSGSSRKCTFSSTMIRTKKLRTKSKSGVNQKQQFCRLKEDRGLFVCSKDFDVNTIADIINNIGPKFTATPSKRSSGILSVVSTYVHTYAHTYVHTSLILAINIISILFISYILPHYICLRFITAGLILIVTAVAVPAPNRLRVHPNVF